MSYEAKFVRRWEYDGLEFKSKREVTEYRARAELVQFATVDALIANADAVIALLKPFATPKRRVSKKAKAANGPVVAANEPGANAPRKPGKPAEAHV